MPIIAAAVVPHSPLLIPAIAKDHTARSVELLNVLKNLGQELYAIQPETVVFLTPHGPNVTATTTIEVGDTLTGTLIEFGDIKTNLRLPAAVGLSHRLKEVAEDTGIPLTLQSATGLDYGVTVPWVTLWPEPMPWTVMPIAVQSGSLEMSIRLGELLRDFFQSRPERVVLIASGDTNRRSKSMTESDRRPTHDERFIAEAITHIDGSRLSGLHTTDMCLREPLVALLSCLNGLPWVGTMRMFDVPLTVGQFVAEFHPI